jgi:hypothetical protein
MQVYQDLFGYKWLIECNDALQNLKLNDFQDLSMLRARKEEIFFENSETFN